MFATTPEAVRARVPDRELREGLLDEFTATWAQRAESRAFLRRYAESFSVPGSDASDYALREVSLGGGASVLAGIHFYGGNPQFPFVGVYAQSRPLDAGEIERASARLRAEWSRFAPRASQWWMAEPRTLPGSRDDQRWLFGDLREFGAQSVSALPLPAGLALRTEDDTDCHAAYARIFDAWIREHPAWRGRLAFTDETCLARCARAGGLYTLREGEQLAGMIAAAPERFRGLNTWVVQEEILAGPYLGRGIAPAMQAACLAQLDPNRARFVSGTIDAENTASLRTALRCGRYDVAGWIFVSGDGSIPQLPGSSPLV